MSMMQPINPLGALKPDYQKETILERREEFMRVLELLSATGATQAERAKDKAEEAEKAQRESAKAQRIAELRALIGDLRAKLATAGGSNSGNLASQLSMAETELFWMMFTV